MFSNLTDEHFNIIGNMPIIPYEPDPYYAPNPNTSPNFIYNTDNPDRYYHIYLDIEKFEKKLKYNQELRIQQNKIITDEVEFALRHSWNYNEHKVTPYEYTLLTKIIIPDNKIIVPHNNQSLPENIDYLLCTESSSSLFKTVQPHTPRRIKCFNYAFVANNNTRNITIPNHATTPTSIPTSIRTPTLKKSHKKNTKWIDKKIDKKSHKKKSHKKKVD